MRADAVTAREPGERAAGQRDLRAELVSREFTGWAEAQGYDDGELYSFAEMDEAFASGMDAQAALAAPLIVAAGQPQAGDCAALAALLAEVLDTFSATSLVGGQLKGDAVSCVGMSDLRQWREQAAIAAAAAAQTGDGALVVRFCDERGQELTLATIRPDAERKIAIPLDAEHMHLRAAAPAAPDSARDALEAQTLHDSPGADL